MIKNNRIISMFILGLMLCFFAFYMFFEPSFYLKIIELPFFIGYLLLISHIILLIIFACWLFMFKKYYCK